MERYSAYDRFARIYNQHWGDDFSQRALPLLDKLLLGQLPPAARLLDVCCGTGQLAQALAERGYQVTGLDGSEEMLRLARVNAPAAEFLLGDAREFSLPPIYHGAISAYDSLNHILHLEQLTGAFRCVRAALLDGGLFVFDLNLEEGYKSRWRGSFGIAEDDHACVVRSRYQPDERLAWTDITLFFLESGWVRSDLTLTQRCYSEAEVCAALETAGFIRIQIYDALKDLDFPGGVGRAFFVAHKGEK